MARRRAVKRDMTIEEFETWAAASTRTEDAAAAADEGGGPSLSLVPVIEQDVAWPTDLLPPSEALPLHGGGLGGGDASTGTAGLGTHPTPPHQGERNQPQHGGGAAAADTSSGESPAPVAAMPFDGVELPATRNRLAGWSADRQRYFLATLAETGSVHLASSAARLSARSAYKLRTRSPAFAAAWDTALQLAVGRLSAIVFDRAIHGRVEQVFADGDLVAERRVPSDKLLTWLLARLDPKRFALPWEQRGDADPQAEAVARFPALLDALDDTVSD